MSDYLTYIPHLVKALLARKSCCHPQTLASEQKDISGVMSFTRIGGRRRGQFCRTMIV